MYKQRSLRFEFVNNTEAFDEGGNNTISLSNVKSTVSCQSSGNLFGTQVSVNIFGLSIDLLAALSAKAMGNFGPDTAQISMKIFVDNTAIFVGYMNSSIANMNSAPNSSLIINATANTDLQNKVARPFSLSGATSVVDIISSICKAAGYSPIINGLEGIMVSNPHYEGSVFDQLQKVCDDLQVSMSVAPPTISFWPQKGQKDSIKPLISPEHGLIGYPIFSNGGVMFQAQFSSLLTTGRAVHLETSLPHASGDYQLTSVTHELSSWVEDGPWHSICIANRKAGPNQNGG